ncbi:MAG: hypothetical protein ABI651_01510 [Verrucomicrobiota bacterium]
MQDVAAGDVRLIELAADVEQDVAKVSPGIEDNPARSLEVWKDPSENCMPASRVQAAASPDLRNMGLSIVSFDIRDIHAASVRKG